MSPEPEPIKLPRIIDIRDADEVLPLTESADGVWLSSGLRQIELEDLPESTPTPESD